MTKAVLSALTSMTMVIVLSACTSSSTPSPVSQPVGQGSGDGDEGKGPVGPVVPVPVIGSLAESLESVSFTYDLNTRRVQVSFSRLMPENVDAAGRPQTEFSPGFEAEVPAGAGSVVLAAENPRDYGITVECDGESCERATIRISKLQGALAGQAVVRREERRIGASFMRSMPLGARTTSSDPLTSSLAEFNSRENLERLPSLTLTRPEGGRHAWFEMRYDFLPVPVMAPGQNSYYEDKSLTISGEVAAGSVLNVRRAVTRDGVTTTTQALVKGTTKLALDPLVISTRFDRPTLGNPGTAMTESREASNPF